MYNERDRNCKRIIKEEQEAETKGAGIVMNCNVPKQSDAWIDNMIYGHSISHKYANCKMCQNSKHGF